MEERDILDEPIRENEKIKIARSDFKAAAKLFAVVLAILGVEIILFIMIRYFELDNDYTTIAFMLLSLAFLGYLIAAIFYGIKGIVLRVW